MAVSIISSGLWKIATGTKQEVLDEISSNGGFINIFGFAEDTANGTVSILYHVVN